MNHLSFGLKLRNENIEILEKLVSRSYFDSGSLAPLDEHVFVNLNQHQSFHHYMKVCMLVMLVVDVFVVTVL